MSRLLDLAKAAVAGSLRSHKDAERDEVREMGRMVVEMLETKPRCPKCRCFVCRPEQYAGEVGRG
jgi:hypothetical protein